MLPLAAQLRPNTLEDFIGQSHLVGPGKPLRLALEQHQIFSIIFWGPPGVGKTTLARLLAKETHHPFVELSAVSAGKAEVKAVIEQALSPQPSLLQPPGTPVLFLDEIHRFNKAQQDFLLPYVERGDIILIGATTENPSFEVIPALLSRTRVFVLEQLSTTELHQILEQAIKTLHAEYPDLKLTPEAAEWLVRFANGDARKLLTIIDNALQLYHQLDLDSLKQSLQSHLSYDKQGEEHYNTISAFIKSMRASNVDAALYYLARMVAAGEDPKFIARRMVIFASEDIGLAHPTALVVATAVFQAVNLIGYPEAQINLAHGVAYLCTAPKNREAYNAYFAALDDVKKHGNLPIPMSLRNAPTKLMKDHGYGTGYEMYPPEGTSLLPDKLARKHYFSPTETKPK